MPGVEVVPEIVKVVTTMAPALRSVPIARGLIVPLSRVGNMNETKALEELESQRQKKREERTRLKKKYNKRVIKISKAMECVENSVYNGRLILDVGKAILSTVTGGNRDFGDLLFGRIAECMIAAALQQKNKRTRGSYIRRDPKTQEVVFEEKERIRRGKLHPFA